MGIFQKAVETFDYMNTPNRKRDDEKEPLAPVGFIISKANIMITLTEEGEFYSAERTDDEKIIIPVTEESANRTSGAAKTRPHPLFDKLTYFDPENGASYDAYVEQLEKWCDSEHAVPEIRTVLRYVKKGTVANDLREVKNVKEDDVVCWRILSGLGTSDKLWENQAVIDSYTAYSQSRINDNPAKDYCYVLGEKLPVTTAHLKGVVAAAGNAKLISSNDKSNYTYRGRFTDDEEALTVSYAASQKAHNALKWLVANQGIRLGDRTMICWSPKGKSVYAPTRSLFTGAQNREIIPSSYKQQLCQLVEGYKKDIEFDDDVVTAVFQAATPGRLSVSYYNEMQMADYLDRLQYWDETCVWAHSWYGVNAPALSRIVDAAYGVLRTGTVGQRVETDEKAFPLLMQRLVLCKLEKKPFPLDIMMAAVRKCATLQLYDDGYVREEQLTTTCAIIRKYKIDHLKEEWEMSLEPDKKNRSYQFGRLLAVMEKAERDTYDKNEKRETNAIRMQSVFVKRPLYVSKMVIEQLKSAYYPSLSAGAKVYYDKLIGEIMGLISGFGETEINRPLKEDYLLGYYLQKNAFYQKNNKEENEEV